MGIDFEIDAVPAEGGQTIRLKGELDAYTAGRFREVMDRVVDDQPLLVVIDVTELTFIDSTGLGLLVGARRKMGADGHIRLIGARPKIFRLFEIAGLTHIFEIESLFDIDGG